MEHVESELSGKNGWIAYKCDDCSFFLSSRKSIGYEGLTLNQADFDGDPINS